MATVTHTGRCHCGAVQFQFQAAPRFTGWSCNCSICNMKRNIHVVVPEKAFQLLQGQDKQTLYTFGSKTAKHWFCSTCGISSYYTPRSNPDGVAVTLACIAPETIESVTIKSFDGQNWEQTIKSSNITECSKP